MAAQRICTAASFDLLTVITSVIALLSSHLHADARHAFFLSSACTYSLLCPAGQEKEQVRKDIGRNRYFTPPQAIEYGLIDRIVQPEDAVAIEEKNYELLLQQANAQQKGQQRVPAGASAEGGY